jgi:hypothetical protein
MVAATVTFRLPSFERHICEAGNADPGILGIFALNFPGYGSDSCKRALPVCLTTKY